MKSSGGRDEEQGVRREADREVAEDVAMYRSKGEALRRGEKRKSDKE